MSRLIKIERKGPTPGVARKRHNRIAKVVWADVAIVWGEVMRPKHFTEAAVSEYRYRKLSKQYEDRKQRYFGHRRPMVYTGETEQRTANYQVRSTSKGATVSMNAPALNYSRRAHQLKKITKPEANTLANEYAGGYGAELKRTSESTTETIKG